jgi:hypothetical protein
MTRPEQKARELASVNRLRELDPKFPAGNIEETDEPLDALVRLATGGCIGIEVREFARDDAPTGSQLNAYQDLTHKIAAAAQHTYVMTSGPPILASLFFDRDFRCRSRDIAKMGASIAAEVAKVAPSVSWSADIYGWEVGLSNGIDRILLHGVASLKDPSFAPMYADFYGELLPSQIDYILEQKQSKLRAYRQKCEQIWLLVVIDGFKLSGWSEPSSHLAEQTYQTGFDRLLLLYDNSRVIELKIEA